MLATDAFETKLRMLCLEGPDQMTAMEIAGRFTGNDQNVI